MTATPSPPLLLQCLTDLHRPARRLRGLALLLVLAAILAAVPCSAATPPPEPGWWMTPRRMIQTNLREIDARMDYEAYVAALQDFRANVVLFNVGGIVANYETDIPGHYRNPYMRPGYAREVIRRLHEAGMRVIGRFDFSKVNVSIAREHPEWVSRDAQGRPFPAYNGQVPVCLNGPYQQQVMFDILAEAIDRLPLDGVFFNMIGYPTRDYSGRHLGICHCEGCRTRFREMYGMELPAKEDPQDPVFRAYQQFKERTIREQFLRVQALIKSKNPGLAICTYTDAGVDVIRKESNTPKGRWLYEDSEKARLTRLRHPDQQLANAAVHFFHYPHRHTAVSPWLTLRRLWQHMVNGAWLDFYCIGPLHTLEDRSGLAQVREVFRFHAANERWLTNTVPLADVALVADGPCDPDEWRGLFRILSERHVSFRLVLAATMDLTNYPCVIAPDGGRLADNIQRRLDKYVRAGGRLLLTGPKAPTAVATLGVQKELPALPREKSTYIRIRPADKARLLESEFNDLDLLFLDGPLGRAEFHTEVEGLLRYIPPAMFGPPEKCYYTNVSDIPALHVRQANPGLVAWLPWRVGAHYEQQGHAGHAALLDGLLKGVLKAPRTAALAGPEQVEMVHRGDPEGRFEWVSLLNLSGMMDGVAHAPIPVRHVGVRVRPRAAVTRVRLLHAGEPVRFHRRGDGSVECTVPELRDFEIVLFETTKP